MENRELSVFKHGSIQKELNSGTERLNYYPVVSLQGTIEICNAKDFACAKRAHVRVDRSAYANSHFSGLIVILTAVTL